MPNVNELERYGALLSLRRQRTERDLRQARALCEKAERERSACRQCVETETTRLTDLVDYLANPDVSSSASRYAQVLLRRDAVAVNLAREMFMLDRAELDCRRCNDALSCHLSTLAALHEKQRKLGDHVRAVRDDNGRAGDNGDALELEELAVTRSAHVSS